MSIDDIFERKVENLIYKIHPYNRLSKYGKEELIIYFKELFIQNFIDKFEKEYTVYSDEYHIDKKFIDGFE